MKLGEALQAVGAARELPLRSRLFLACGFEPLHLPTFLQAHYLARFPGQALAVSFGQYGDLPGNLERAGASDASLAVVVLEWTDIDARLGLRSTGSWSAPELASDVQGRLARLRELIRDLSTRMPVVLAPPSLPFGLAGQTVGWQLSPLELRLERLLYDFLASFAEEPRVQVLHPQRLAAQSPSPTRRDARLELAAGFPYSTRHASELALGILTLAYPSPPKKGLITDLDDTLWSGLVGEVGVDAIAWGQADHAQIHGLYQSLLRQLAEAGVLLAIASKNEASVVELALGRQDLLVPKTAFFPVIANWGPKSATVSSILHAWNISADAVVVVDDSRMELEEIRSVHPEINVRELTRKDPAQVLALLEELRDLFGKPENLAEDRLRSASLRSRGLFEAQKQEQDMPSFLLGLGGKLSFDARKNPEDARLFELINKTNQWNLNGQRLERGEWLRLLARPDSFVLGVAYGDRYGALGTIGVVAGTLTADAIQVEHWVLSCRAFSRRIEDHMLERLLTLAPAQDSADGSLRLEYRKTEKNKPFQEFLGRLALPTEAAGTLRISRAAARELTLSLPHAVTDAESALPTALQPPSLHPPVPSANSSTPRRLP
jgi:FkbH-like protein